MTNTIRNKATFRAMREQAGYTKTEFANHLGVNKNSVWRWESEEFDNEPPEDVWETLENIIEKQLDTVEKTMAAIRKYENDYGRPPKKVKLTYYRTQKEYDEQGRDKADVRTINAATRFLGTTLTMNFYDVEYSYPDATLPHLE